jgi:alpha-tubulin suppressor-like RCC1 family protein
MKKYKCIPFYIFILLTLTSSFLFAFDSGKRITAGKDYSLFVDNDQNVWSWGNNFSGKLGYDNTNMDKIYPVKIAVLNRKKIENILAGCNNTFAIDDKYNLWGWGENLLNYIGLGIGSNEVYTPTIIDEVKNVYNITTSCNHTLILTNNKVFAWGEGYMGQLGINDRNRSYVYKPMEVYNLQNVVDISAGNSFSIALRSDGDAYTWGNNQYGQLGVNFVPFPPPNELIRLPLQSLINNMIHYTSKYTIVPVKTSQPNNIKELKVVNISAGGDHALALLEDGTVWAWGRNDLGQLGNGKSYNFTNIPTKVLIPNDVHIKAVSAGQNHSLALDSNGNVWAWGDNSFGQLGNLSVKCTDNFCTTPVKVKKLFNIDEISAGSFHNLALDHDNTLYGWGNNQYGQLANYGNELIIHEPEIIDVSRKMQPSYILPKMSPETSN